MYNSRFLFLISKDFSQFSAVKIHYNDVLEIKIDIFIENIDDLYFEKKKNYTN